MKILPSILHRMRRRSRKQRAFAMPKLSALLGKPVTPDDETEDADDGRDEEWCAADR